jgi:flagellar biosynthesis chaperone FliJ
VKLIKTLSSIERVQQYKLKEIQARLSILQNEEALLKEKREALLIKKDEEMEISKSSIYSKMTLSSYLERHHILLKAIDAQIDNLSQKIQLIQDELFEFYQESKKNEMLLNQLKEENARELKHKEQKELDELGGISFNRSQKNPN